jgi:hypothetical protein
MTMFDPASEKAPGWSTPDKGHGMNKIHKYSAGFLFVFKAHQRAQPVWLSLLMQRGTRTKRPAGSWI